MNGVWKYFSMEGIARLLIAVFGKTGFVMNQLLNTKETMIIFLAFLLN